MQMPGRVGQNAYYRYAFNGMEQDAEWSSEGNSYTTEFRHYDPRLGRWRSLDPLMAKFPHTSPYTAFADNPILYVDPYGLEPLTGGDESTGGDAASTAIDAASATIDRVYTLREFTVTAYANDASNSDPSLAFLPGGAAEVLSEVEVLSQGASKVKNVQNLSRIAQLASNAPAVGLTALFVMIPIEAGKGDIPQYELDPLPWPYEDPDEDPLIENDPEFITLYRGVGDQVNPYMQYTLAKGGYAFPKGALAPYYFHDDLEMHSAGDNYTLYTSWTDSYEIAESFASGYGKAREGVVMKITVHRSRVFKSPPDYVGYAEGEYLVFGIIRADWIDLKVFLQYPVRP